MIANISDDTREELRIAFDRNFAMVTDLMPTMPERERRNLAAFLALSQVLPNEPAQDDAPED